MAAYGALYRIDLDPDELHVLWEIEACWSRVQAKVPEPIQFADEALADG